MVASELKLLDADPSLSDARDAHPSRQADSIQMSKLTIGNALSPTRIAKKLRTSKTEIATTLGLGKGAFSKKEQIKTASTQTRLREMLEILRRVEPQAGSVLAAYAWFREAPLPGYGHLTSDQLVREGHADWVHNYLDHVMAGGYA